MLHHRIKILKCTHLFSGHEDKHTQTFSTQYQEVFTEPKQGESMRKETI